MGMMGPSSRTHRYWRDEVPLVKTLLEWQYKELLLHVRDVFPLVQQDSQSDEIVL